MDNGPTRDTFPAMRAAVLPLAVACVGLLGASACIPDKDKEPEWQKPPESFDPQSDELTFGKKNLEAFNMMSSSERETHLEQLKAKAGGFKGQANFQRASEMGEAMEDAQYGKHEVFATVTDPVLYEITVDYQLFSNEPIGQGLPPGTPIEFTGTLAGLNYKDDAKPRKLEVKLKDVSIERLTD